METAATTLANGARFEDRYEILGELGSGSFSRVYRAKQLSTGQSVAIKLLSEREASESSTGNEAERFRRETQICAALSHAFIVRLLDSGETQEGQLYAVFEHVSGETLGQTIQSEGQLDVRESLRLMTQVLDALSCAHAKGIVHRDLKPANLMLSGTGARRNALVLDFGLGGVVENRRREEWETLTQNREFLGTPMYAAPEQLSGEVPTERSDLYAWGLIFLECLTGQHPFAAEGAAARLMTGGGAVEIPVWLRDHRLGALLASVTVREPAKRDVSLETLIEALDEIARGELPIAPEMSPTPAPLIGQGERRHLTVMFCDLFGSTALSQQLDAETYREIMRAYQARGAEAVERYDGHVVQYLGDGLLVYFGYPQAHEDDAERAIRAGRDVLRGLEMLSTRTEAEYGVPVTARVGIHTGPVVVGEMGGGQKIEVLALGDTPNIAARLEGFAEPGTVVISDATLRLVAGLFVTENRGVPELKGIDEPICAHRILQPSGIRSRLERSSGLTPFVGRSQELGLLLDRFEQTQEGRGQAVLIGGEAGIGKSRLVHELRQRLRDLPHSWLKCRTSPYRQSSALHPLIEMLEVALDFRNEDAANERVGKLERGLVHVGFDPDETLPLFASLLTLRLPERYAPLEISPQLQRQKTLQALLAWTLALGEKQPVVLLVEDLHWADPSTIECLGLLIEQCPTSHLLLLMTHRPVFEPPWSGREHMLPIRLNRLRERETREMIDGSATEVALPAEIVERITSRSDGVPLFVEELAKGAVEAGHTDPFDIPETLQDSLMARLDRLAEAKEVAQFAAAIGREFEYGLLESVAPIKESALREGLGRLVEAELIYQRGLPPDATYTFKHALVLDTAYQSLLGNQRRELHGRIADALLARMPEAAEQQPELVAHHLSEGSEPNRAIEYWQRAGDRSLAHLASREADSHFERGLELLDALPNQTSRDRCELPLRLGLGASRAIRGEWATEETARIWRRALELADTPADQRARAGALWGLSAMHQSRSEFRESLQLAVELRDTAVALGDVWVELAGWNQIINAHHLLGEPEAAVHRLDEMLARDPVTEPDPTWFVYGVCQRIAARGWAAGSVLACGYPDRAAALCDEVVAMAEQLPSPVDLCFAAALANGPHELMQQTEAVRANAEAMLTVSEGPDMDFWAGNAQMSAAWSNAAEGILDEDPAAASLRGFERLNAGAHGNLTTATHVMWLHADVLRRVGQFEEAEEWAQNALMIAETKEQHFMTPTIHQTLGEICLGRDEPDAAQAARQFERALGVARSQNARFHELRAATSLARLLRENGQRDEARELLAPIYDWFTEGFDTQGLKDAKVLLEELA
jgi:TOMM system kinase/cyclase fusion protein